MANELLNYFTNNNFELEAQISLTNKSLSSPTQKEFNVMFQWLYKRIDPGYRFMKSMDAEIPPLLTQLHYPFEKSITKSQIAAVGGNNWHTFLGLLHWLMQLAQSIQFGGAKSGFALFGKDLWNRTAQQLLDRGVKVRKPPTQMRRQQAPDCGLSRAHEAGQHDPAQAVHRGGMLF